MKKRLLTLIWILCMLMPAFRALAASDHPIRMTAEPDPECELTGSGTLSYVRFVIKNTGDEDYTLYYPMLSSEVMDEACSLYFESGSGEAAEAVTLEPGTVREFRIYDVYLPQSALNTDVLFTLSWSEAVYEEPEDPYPEEEYDPYPEEGEPYEDEEQWAPAETGRSAPQVTYVKRKVSASVFVETSDVPAMQLSLKTDSSLVRTDGTVRVKYVLTNPTKYDFEDITLTDDAAGGEIALEDTVLRAGDTMTVMHSFTMGRENAVLSPEAVYSVRGRMRRAACEKPVTVEFMFDSLTLDVQQNPATEQGTVFALTVTNAGTHRMKDIELEDDTGTELCPAFSLNPGQSRSLTYTYGSYTGLQENRRVSFLLRATDGEGETYFYQKPGSYEILPYVGSGQVSLLMNVTLAEYSEEKNTVQLLFEMRNYSDVAISNAFIYETEVLKTAVKNYPSLTKGVTTFTMDFSLSEGVSVLTFHMEADDAGGTHYATEPVSLQVDQLALSVKNGTFGQNSNTVIDTSGTVFDTDKYRSYIVNGLLALLFAAFVFILISLMFRVAEKYVRRSVPEQVYSEHITGAGNSVQDTARLRFGYMKPAKLRYGSVSERTQMPPMPHPVKTSGAQPVSSDTGTFKKPGRQIKMLTQEDTLIFGAPVPPREKAAFISDYTRKKETPSAGVTRKTARVPVTIKAEPEPVALPEEAELTVSTRPLTMAECLEAGRPYTFEAEPLPAVIPPPAEPEIVFISAPSPLA